MSVVTDLQQRRTELESQLSALRRQRELAFRANSDALARQRAGVAHQDDAAMSDLAADEVAGDAAMTEIQRELGRIDDELAAGGGHRLSRWLRT